MHYISDASLKRPGWVYERCGKIIDLLRSYLNVADDDVQKSLIQAAIDQLKATDPDNLSVAP